MAQLHRLINKARTACEVCGHPAAHHFVDVNKMIRLAKGAEREVPDLMLSRYACCLVAQNGDPTKHEIAFAQTYFAIQTRRAELVEQRMLEAERVAARKKLSATEKELSGVIYERTGGNQDFAPIRSKGDQALFGKSTQAMKAHWKVPDNRPLADFALLITFLLCQREILLKPVLYLSHFFKQHRAEYCERLQAVRDRGDWEGWLAFFLRGIASVSREATETARRILALRENHRAAVTTGLGRAAANGHRVLEHLYQRPILSVAEVQALTGSTYTAANNLVVRLVGLGILVEATGYRRNRVFRYQAYIDIFGEQPEQTTSATT